MAHDVVPVLAASYHGSAPRTSLDPTGGMSVAAGGMDYVPDQEPVVPEDRHCIKFKANGAPCRAWAGEDGVCNGHRRQEYVNGG